MSDHVLPDDPAAWPRDAFHLLGVARGVSERELRRAYHALIRKYKPEHAPEAFRRIREAYETAQKFGTFVQFWEEPAQDVDDEHQPSTAERRVEELGNTDALAHTRPFWEDEWDHACEGAETLAYHGLLQRLDRGQASEEVFLRLYWLLVVIPGLDRLRNPGDWLVRGLNVCRSRAPRLRELLKRELAADPSAAVGGRFADYVTPGTSLELVRDIAAGRWRAARILGRWKVIADDLNALRKWMPQADAECWVRLLLCVAGNLIWGSWLERKMGLSHRQTAERIAAEYALDISDELNELDFAEAIVNGLAHLRLTTTYDDAMLTFCSLAWDDSGPEQRPRLLAVLRSIARDPIGSLTRLDALKNAAPAALGLLWGLAGVSRGDPSDPAIVEAVEIFVGQRLNMQIPKFRLELLQFCLRQMIPPATVAAIVEKHLELMTKSGEPMGDWIAGDWSLHLVYRAYEISWE